MVTVLKTCFLPAERDSESALAPQLKLLHSNPSLLQMLDCFPEPAMVLNQHRQIVLGNNKLARLLGRTRESLTGYRPGELFNCLHSTEDPNGCGTTQFCGVCGAAQAMAHTLAKEEPNVQECRITCMGPEGPYSLDLRIWTTPISVGPEKFMVFAIRDISDENRRKVLERIFFHDALNSAHGIKGLIQIWPEIPAPEVKRITDLAQKSAEELVEIIESQRDLAAAERGELKVAWTEQDIYHLLQNLVLIYSNHSIAQRKKIAPLTFSGSTRIVTDGILLSRVLGNLIKNALEASSAGQTVTIRFENQENPVFTIHNEAVMPPEVRLQIFQRSFSTKGVNHRGIGSYSVKLLAERFLKGTVSFFSKEGKGTTFIVSLPRHP